MYNENNKTNIYVIYIYNYNNNNEIKKKMKTRPDFLFDVSYYCRRQFIINKIKEKKKCQIFFL